MSEEMYKCEACAGWIRSFSGNSCTCIPQVTFEERKGALLKRQAEVKDEFGGRAQVVPKYKPNRKQRRAQDAAMRAATHDRKEK